MFKKYKYINISKKNIIVYIFSAIFIIAGVLLWSTASAQDLMEQAFSTARTYDTIVNLWNTKDAVWNEILRESASIWLSDGAWKKWCYINDQLINTNENGCKEQWWIWESRLLETNTNPPLIVRITKFLLRMTIILSITMVIFNAVVYMVEAFEWKDRKTADAKKNLIWVAGGVIVALMSVSMINLVVSVPKSSIKTSDEVSNFIVSCKIKTTILEWDELKKQVCLNATFGHTLDTIQYRERDYIKAFSMSADLMEDRAVWWYRCKICNWDSNWAWNDCKWKKITNSEAKSKCVEDLWWTTL